MTASSRPDEPNQPKPDEPEKKPYRKPAFVREQLFETTALACGKINPTQRQCNLVRKNS